MYTDEPNAFLGRGISFPVRVDPQTGEMMTVAYEDDIKEAIRIILFTRKGEREANPRYYIFASLDYTTLSRMKHEIEDALVEWEPRIENISVELTEPGRDGRLEIRIGYVVRSTNNPFNLVYPYYLNEGFGE